tara:strand:+ start:359 stop:586 length:228 start_codon:yes stop_codon:yes gene_type:complete
MKVSLAQLKETNADGYSANVVNDIRVIKNIERRAQDLRWELNKIEARWENRVEKLDNRLDFEGVYRDYNFNDILC